MWQRIWQVLGGVATLLTIVAVADQFGPRIRIWGRQLLPTTGNGQLSAILMTVAAVLSVASLIVWSFFPRTEPEYDVRTYKFETIIGREFRNEAVLLDGKAFMNCTFTNVTMEFNGTGPVKIEYCTFNGIYFTSSSGRIKGTVALLKALRMLNPQIDLSRIPVEEAKIVRPDTTRPPEH